MRVGTLERANEGKSVCDAMIGHMRPAQTKKLDFAFVITVIQLMISSTK